MSRVIPGVAVNGCTEERKEIKIEIRKIYLIIYLYIMYTYLVGVAELGGALGTEVMEVLV